MKIEVGYVSAMVSGNMAADLTSLAEQRLAIALINNLSEDFDEQKCEAFLRRVLFAAVGTGSPRASWDTTPRKQKLKKITALLATNLTEYHTRSIAAKVGAGDSSDSDSDKGSVASAGAASSGNDTGGGGTATPDTCAACVLFRQREAAAILRSPHDDVCYTRSDLVSMVLDDVDVKISLSRLTKTPAWKELLQTKATERNGDVTDVLHVDLLSARQRRLVLYQKMYHLIFGRTKKGTRKKLPTCIRYALRQKHPDDADDRKVLASLAPGADDLHLG